MPSARLALVFMISLLAWSCAGNDAVAPASPEATTQELTIRHVLERSVPSGVTHFRFTGFDAQGKAVFGPVIMDKASEIKLSVPTSVVRQSIEYLQGDRLVGSYSTPVPPNLIEDPPWSDALPSFTGSTFPVGSRPVDVAVGDLNQDGNPDLAVCNQGAGTVSVLLGDGRGQFPTNKAFTVGASPVGVRVGDVNNDGHLDLVTANSGSASETASVLLGDGSGSFSPAASVYAGPAPAGVALGDVNNDGHLDLAVTNNQLNAVSVLLGNGNGTFQTPRTFPLGQDPEQVVLADFDRDGKLDLMVSSFLSNTLEGLRGNGDGNFSTDPRLSGLQTGAGPLGLAVADLNQDGTRDLAAVNFSEGTTSVFLNQTSGGFLARPKVTVGGSPLRVALGDLNKDGYPDLIAANFASNTLSLAAGNGDGTFQTPQSLATGAGPDGLAIAPLTATGPAVVVTNDQADSVTTFLP